MIGASKKFIFKIPYPKLILLLASFFLAYLIYTDENNFYFHQTIGRLGYFGTFMAGVFFMYGFTTAPAAVILMLNSQTQNILLAWAVAGLGAIVGGFLALKILKLSFTEELDEIYEKESTRWIAKKIDRLIPDIIKKYVLPAFAAIIAASPLPEELSMALIAASKDISYPVFTAVYFFFSTFGFLIILYLGRIL